MAMLFLEYSDSPGLFLLPRSQCLVHSSGSPDTWECPGVKHNPGCPRDPVVPQKCSQWLAGLLSLLCPYGFHLPNAGELVLGSKTSHLTPFSQV